MQDAVLGLLYTGWDYCMYILMVVEIAYAYIVDQFSHLVNFVVTIIMLTRVVSHLARSDTPNITWHVHGMHIHILNKVAVA